MCDGRGSINCLCLRSLSRVFSDQVWHSSNDCPKQQKSSVIPAIPASSRTPGILSPNPLFSRSAVGNSGDRRVTDSTRGVRVYHAAAPAASLGIIERFSSLRQALALHCLIRPCQAELEYISIRAYA
ncbi:hypothetical protein VC83_01751 [Pseudogymnoascus destructans]|uniref:Uncharacterized protein n=1 Tax=Pseudogymnoascus destructans TaxID=655981 RepID=A0A177AKW5_9PEZI|nr:uncharacterized protein VC83_01751 [Pseudogymnoascus destructans]OAF62142.1 hypothetical protein VC83_01751 [Pseudogymnoascus destructans]